MWTWVKGGHLITVIQYEHIYGFILYEFNSAFEIFDRRLFKSKHNSKFRWIVSSILYNY